MINSVEARIPFQDISLKKIIFLKNEKNINFLVENFVKK